MAYKRSRSNDGVTGPPLIIDSWYDGYKDPAFQKPEPVDITEEEFRKLLPKAEQREYQTWKRLVSKSLINTDPYLRLRCANSNCHTVNIIATKKIICGEKYFYMKCKECGNTTRFSTSKIAREYEAYLKRRNLKIRPYI